MLCSTNHTTTGVGMLDQPVSLAWGLVCDVVWEEACCTVVWGTAICVAYFVMCIRLVDEFGITNHWWSYASFRWSLSCEAVSMWCNRCGSTWVDC